MYYVRQNLQPKNRIAQINPFDLYWISPDHIRRFSGGSFDFIVDTSAAKNGSWDCHPNTPIDEYSKYRLFKEHFAEGIPWEKAELYSQIIDRICDGRSDRYATVSEFKSKCIMYENIYAEFENGNYQLQSELVAQDETSPPGDGGRALFPSRTDRSLVRHEIAVDIGRDGELLLNEGRHRLPLALLAGIDEIPVRAVVRHTGWQAFRDDIARTIDEAYEADVGLENVRNYVQNRHSETLEDVFLGLEHPDLEVIFERRLPDQK